MKLDEFVIEPHPIGEGVAGTVFRATHTPSATRLALKLINSLHQHDVDSTMLAEALIQSRLSHPHIARIFGFGLVEQKHRRHLPQDHRDKAGWWMAVELGDASLAAQTEPTREEALRWTHQALLGLAHAHARGVLHLDIKPQNLVLAGDRLMVVDFSIASLWTDSKGRKGRYGMGTAAYCAPEQQMPTNYGGGWWRVGPASDLFSVGVVALQLLTGPLPWASLPWHPALFHKSTGRGRPPGLDNLPEALRAWLLSMLGWDGGKRYSRASDALRELKPLLVDTSLPPRSRRAHTPASLNLVATRLPEITGRDTLVDELLATLDDPRRGLHVIGLIAPPDHGCTTIARSALWRARELGRADGVDLTLRDGDWEQGVRHLLNCPEGAEGEHHERWLKDSSKDLADWELVAWLGQPQRDASDPQRVASLAALLAKMAQGHPLVVVASHLATDPQALAVLAELAPRCGAQQAQVLVLDPDADRKRWAALDGLAARLVEVPALSDHQIDEALQSLLPLSEVASHHLQRLAGGNIDVALTQLRSWISQGVLQRAGPQGFTVTDASTTLTPVTADKQSRDLAGTILDGEDSSRDALATLAILGVAVALGELVADEDAPLRRPSPAALLRLSVYGVVETDGEGWRFTHPRHRQAALAVLEERGLRKEWEKRAADALEGSTALDAQRQGALHRVRSGALAAGHARLLDVARQFLDAGRPHPVLGALDLLDHDAPARAGQLSEAARVEEAALRIEALFATNDFARAEHGIVELGTSDTAKAVKKVLGHRRLFEASGSTRESAKELLEAANQLRALEEPRWVGAMVHYVEQAALLSLHDSQELLQLLDEASASPSIRGIERSMIEAQRSRLHSNRGQLDLARGSARAALDLAREAGNAGLISAASFHLGTILRLQGSYGEADDLLSEAVDAELRALRFDGAIRPLNTRSDVALQQGRVDDAFALQEQCCRLSDAIGNAKARAWAELGTAHGCALIGKPDRCDELLRRCTEVLAGDFIGDLVCKEVRVRYLWLIDEPGEALTLARELATAQDKGNPYHRGRAHLLLSAALWAAGQREEAMSEAEDATSSLDESGSQEATAARVELALQRKLTGQAIDLKRVTAWRLQAEELSWGLLMPLLDLLAGRPPVSQALRLPRLRYYEGELGRV